MTNSIKTHTWQILYWEEENPFKAKRNEHNHINRNRNVKVLGLMTSEVNEVKWTFHIFKYGKQ